MHDFQPVTPASLLAPDQNCLPSPNPEFAAWPLPRPITPHRRRFSGVSITSVTKGRKDFALQKVDPFFTDADGEYTDEFKRMLTGLDSKTSETDLCIEQYLVRSEKQWFEGYKSAKFGLSPSRNASKVSLVEATTPAPPSSSRFLDIPSRPASPYAPSVISSVYSEDDDHHSNAGSRRFISAFESEEGGANPNEASPIQKFMLRKVFDWPVYTLVLAFGQILAANSYQISLLNGEQGQTASMLYTIASIYGGTSISGGSRSGGSSLFGCCPHRLPSTELLSFLLDLPPSLRPFPLVGGFRTSPLDSTPPRRPAGPCSLRSTLVTKVSSLYSYKHKLHTDT
jgi:alpha-1,3-glucan synthase